MFTRGGEALIDGLGDDSFSTEIEMRYVAPRTRSLAAKNQGDRAACPVSAKAVGPLLSVIAIIQRFPIHQILQKATCCD